MENKWKTNLIGIYLFIILLILIVIPILVFKIKFQSAIIKSLIYVACAGGLGGTLYSIRGFYQNLGEKRFEFNWTWWYIFRPFISIVIGVISYFLIFGGLLSVGNISDVNYEKSIMFYSAISFLAGFSFTQFSNKLEELSKTLFAKKQEDKK
ncbi:MAG: hypothetical protein KJ597_05355 [Nanoarchaeota archaeon]|nr:hypothetical protein [Nanoarchaeota archaeon]MBU1622972.1 hypothetical protein [Nanoarchaeota archaeon]